MSEGSRRPLKVGLYIPNGDGWMSGTINHWTDVLAMAKAAEDVGFDSVWVADHMIFKFDDEPAQSRWECWSLLAGIAAATTRIEIGPLVSCMAFRSPVLLAKIAGTVDEMSAGRLTLAVGAGWHEPEFTPFGFPFDRRASRFEEGFAVLHDLLRTGRSSFKGTFHQVDDCELLPLGPRPSGIPLIVGTNGERLLKFAAKHADGWNTTWIGNTAELCPLMQAVDAACDAAGRDPATLSRTACVYIDQETRIGRFPHDKVTPPPARDAAGNAAALCEFADAGLEHAMLWLDPNTLEAVYEFGKTLELLDRG